MQGALVHEVEAGFVAVKEGEFGRGGLPAESGGDAGDIVARRLVGKGFRHESVFDSPGAAETPVGGGHLFDHAELDPIDGIEAFDVLGEQFGEAIDGFTGENHAIGEEAMADGVLRRTAFAVGGLRAAGESTVGTRGENSSKGHRRDRYLFSG